MKFLNIKIIAFYCLSAVISSASAQEVNVICSVKAAWCNFMTTVHAKTTGVKVNMVTEGSGEALALPNFERVNPKTGILFGGTGDPHLQAAEQNLTLEYKLTQFAALYPWAQKQAADSKYRTDDGYLGLLALGYNTALLAKKKNAPLKSWADLLKPEYKGEMQMVNAAPCGTSPIVLAALVQLIGEDKTFEYMNQLHKNVSTYTPSGFAPAMVVARGEIVAPPIYIHDVTTEATQGFPAASITPSEGTRAEVGLKSIVKDGSNTEVAKKFYGWALTMSG